MDFETGSLHGLKAVVIGAGAIGAAIADALAQAKANVGITYSTDSTRAAENVRTLSVHSPRVASVQCDVTSAQATWDAVHELNRQLGGLDIVVSAIGARASWKRLVDLEPSEWNEYLSVDLTGTFHVFRAVVPLMRERGGAIVALSSIAASMFQARNGQGAAAKAGAEALVLVLAREEGRNNIRVNAVAVGLTESPSTDEAFAKWGADSAARIVGGIPLKRIATPQDVANAVMFLVSPSGRYITGKVIAADGGQYIGH
jgi:3-oxoacyl-[acyl-carrier protein] reductase